MKKLLLTATLAIFSCCTLIGLAQETAKPTTAKAAAADKSDKKGDPAARKGRLPANFGKLGLNDTQKDKIYAIQASYTDQLDALEAQVAAIKGKRDQEVDGVLTEDQRKILKNLTEAAKEKSKKDETTASNTSEKSDK